MLKVNGINFLYGDVQILTDVSLRVEDREFVAIFGPNGHGKSTLLKVIAGLLRAASGSVEFDGQMISQLPTNQIVNAGIVYISEDRNLFPEMTVAENLKSGAYSRRARKSLDENLEFVYNLFPKLKQLRARVAAGLSGGEARMLAIGRGLMSNPRFLAIDEPSFGLAPNLIAAVFRAIDEIRSRGVSILVVEQSTAIASEYADRLYLLEDGRMVFEGSRDEAMSNAELRRVFLGL